DLEWKIEAKEREIQEAQAELGRCQGAGTVTLYDVLVDVEAPGRASLDVEYLVSRTGWQPSYDLRARQDLKGVDLTYRARVWQQTGEDWKDVDVALSTASPQRGAQGPEPQPVWLSLFEPPVDRKGWPGAVAAERVSLGEEARGMGYVGKDAAAEPPAAP